MYKGQVWSSGSVGHPFWYLVTSGGGVARYMHKKYRRASPILPLAVAMMFVQLVQNRESIAHVQGTDAAEQGNRLPGGGAGGGRAAAAQGQQQQQQLSCTTTYSSSTDNRSRCARSAILQQRRRRWQRWSRWSQRLKSYGPCLNRCSDSNGTARLPSTGPGCRGQVRPLGGGVPSGLL
jgi:hypothetical protein